MPTITQRPFQWFGFERGDLAFDRHQWNDHLDPGDPNYHKNYWGKYSRFTHPNTGSLQYFQYGYRFGFNPPYASMYGGATNQPVYITLTYYLLEGCHEVSTAIMFKDLGIPQGTTGITASLDMAFADSTTGAANRGPRFTGSYDPTDNGVNKAIFFGPDPWPPLVKLRMFGIAEDNFTPTRMIDKDTGYDWWYMNQYFDWMNGRDGKVRFYMPQSNIWDRETTVNEDHIQWTTNWVDGPPVVSGTFPGEGTPFTVFSNLGPVIQEIVGRPGWQPNNRLCLIFANDKSMNAGQPNMVDLAYKDPEVGMGGGIPAPVVQYPINFMRPKLTITY